MEDELGHFMLKLLKVRNLVLFLSFLCLTAYSQEDSLISNYSGDFWYINTGARSDAMGGIGTASPKNAFSIFYNPSLIAYLNTKEISLEYTPLYGMQDDLGSGAAVFILPSNLGFGLGYTILQSKNIKGFNELSGTLEDRWQDVNIRPDNIADFEFNYYYKAYRVSLAKWYNMDLSAGNIFTNALPLRMSLGANFKFLTQSLLYDKETVNNLNYSAVTTDFDIGASAKFILDMHPVTNFESKIFTIGLVFQNVNRSSASFNSASVYYDEGELLRRFALSYYQYLDFIKTDAELSIDLIKGDQGHSTRMGFELFFYELIALRAGISEDGYAFGGGVTYQKVSVDYSYKTSELNNTPYRFSFHYEF